jgi:hypothetical protein
VFLSFAFVTFVKRLVSILPTSSYEAKTLICTANLTGKYPELKVVKCTNRFSTLEKDIVFIYSLLFARLIVLLQFLSGVKHFFAKTLTTAMVSPDLLKVIGSAITCIAFHVIALPECN